MKYGYFDDFNKEFVIKKPDTPLPWINYLGCDEFFGIISNTAGGYCFYKDARLRRLTRYRYNNIPFDSNGRYIYIKDNNDVWNPMWKPMKVIIDDYECRHGLGYTIIKGEKKGLSVGIRFFIPVGFRSEVWDVTIKNNTGVIKKIRMWSFIEWCLWDAYDDMTNFQRNFSIGEVEIEDTTIFHITEYRERRNHYAYFYSSLPISGFDTSRDSFVGLHYGLENPQAIWDGNCTNSIAHGWAPIGVHQMDLELSPGEEKRFYFLLGYAENDPGKKYITQNVINKEDFYKVKEYFSKSGNIDVEFDKLREYWSVLLSKYYVETEDEIVNRMVNIWNQYQCMVTFNLSRSASLYESGIGRGIGFRDSNQDILGFVHMVPERARQRILDLASTQMSDGSCFHQYQPLTKKGNEEIGGGFNDDPLWLILSTSAYIKETGDFSILNEKVGYADKISKESTLLDHLDVSINYILNNKGPHGLPLIGHADWNDCLNLNCFSTNPDESFQLAGDISEGKTAESLMIAGLFCVACDRLAEIYKVLGKMEKVDYLHKEADEMREAILKYGWDDEWFLRAYDANGEKIGSIKCDEGKIFIESQAWCVLGGVGIDNGYAKKALESVKKYLATSKGIMLQQPAYKTYHINLGEISSYPPGYKENAGIFVHTNPWIMIAETMLGNGDRAFEYYMNVCPPKRAKEIDIYRAEPYVYSQMIAGKDAPTFGEAKNSWLTGTAAWTFVAISQYILGIRPDFDGLIVDPCIPKSWKLVRVKRVFRNATYDITIENPAGVNKGIGRIIIDDKEIKCNKLPLFSDGNIHKVNVILG